MYKLRLTENNKKYHLSIRTEGETDIERNKIAYSVLDLIGRIEGKTSSKRLVRVSLRYVLSALLLFLLGYLIVQKILNDSINNEFASVLKQNNGVVDSNISNIVTELDTFIKGNKRDSIREKAMELRKTLIEYKQAIASLSKQRGKAIKSNQPILAHQITGQINRLKEEYDLNEFLNDPLIARYVDIQWSIKKAQRTVKFAQYISLPTETDPFGLNQIAESLFYFKENKELAMIDSIIQSRYGILPDTVLYIDYYGKFINRPFIDIFHPTSTTEYFPILSYKEYVRLRHDSTIFIRF